LHPLGIHRSPRSFSFLSAFEDRLMVTECIVTAASMLAIEFDAFARLLTHAFLIIRVMVFMGMLAETFQVLGAKDGDILKHLANALASPAVDLPVNNIVEEVLFKPVAAEALGGGSNGPAVLAITIPPVDVESILSSSSDILLVLFKLSLRHHLTTICIANNPI
jgi:hypothetical protein